ncbi:excalibur calcium-binding domain-containing protein, partial [Psychrobacter sp. UBA6766]|uniref:excalibur calcium-binding domain-containing protein n=1 Tax=Psychrobacter sp. UBA6766 TaxID=1947361 RepID=UPI0025DC805E
EPEPEPEIKPEPVQTFTASNQDCSGLPRTCGQMSSCAQAQKALQCGNGKLDRDNDGVPCESICPGG